MPRFCRRDTSRQQIANGHRRWLNLAVACRILVAAMLAGCGVGVVPDSSPVSFDYTRVEVELAEVESAKLASQPKRDADESRIIYLWAKAAGFCRGLDCGRLTISGTAAGEGSDRVVRNVTVLATDRSGKEHVLGPEEFEPFGYHLGVLKSMDAKIKGGHQ